MVEQLCLSRVERHARKGRINRPQHHAGLNRVSAVEIPDGGRLFIVLIGKHPIIHA